MSVDDDNKGGIGGDGNDIDHSGNKKYHGGECGSCIVLMMSQRNHLIVIIKKGENVNNDVKFDYDRDSVAPWPWVFQKFGVKRQKSISFNKEICERSLTSSTSGPTGPPSTTFVRSEMLHSGFLIRL
ncbi:hypothetical protein JHK87_004189 [Glycine soja]|nr:hypothetical protein JHK87_004189 [Glycine soja]